MGARLEELLGRTRFRVACPECGAVATARWALDCGVVRCRSCGAAFPYRDHTYRPVTGGMTDAEREERRLAVHHECDRRRREAIRADSFKRFARDSTTGLMLGLRRMGGATFTEADRRAIKDGLAVIRTALAQPVGTSAGARVKGAVTSGDYERAKMQVVMGAMQLDDSGLLDGLEVDGG